MLLLLVGLVILTGARADAWAEYRDVLLSPVYKVYEGTEYVYHFDGTDSPVLVWFHGCGHSALNFFPKGANCQACQGLPEDMGIARAAAANGYNILAVSAADKESLCWAYDDKPAIEAVLGIFSKQLGVAASAPRFGFGGSSGAAFLSVIAVLIPFEAIALTPEGIASDWVLSVGELATLGLVMQPPLPPTLVVQMTREGDFNPAAKAKIPADIALLKSLGIDVETIKVEPLQVTDTHFSDRIPGIDEATSTQIVQALQKDWLDRDGFMKRDPRDGKWKSAFPQDLYKALGEFALSESLPQVLNVAWADHEITGDDVDAVLAFFGKYA